MPAAIAPIPRRLRQPPGPPPARPASEPEPADAEQRSLRPETVLLCRECRHPVARPADRIAIQGRHTHTCANPHGHVFEIGCFQSAPGCGAVGPASDEFTWFPGHRWRACVCAACRVHLGWVFLPGAGAGFYGLILDRLIESSA